MKVAPSISHCHKAQAEKTALTILVILFLQAGCAFFHLLPHTSNLGLQHAPDLQLLFFPWLSQFYIFLQDLYSFSFYWKGRDRDRQRFLPTDSLLQMPVMARALAGWSQEPNIQSESSINHLVFGQDATFISHSRKGGPWYVPLSCPSYLISSMHSWAPSPWYRKLLFVYCSL